MVAARSCSSSRMRAWGSSSGGVCVPSTSVVDGDGGELSRFCFSADWRRSRASEALAAPEGAASSSPLDVPAASEMWVSEPEACEDDERSMKVREEEKLLRGIFCLTLQGEDGTDFEPMGLRWLRLSHRAAGWERRGGRPRDWMRGGGRKSRVVQQLGGQFIEPVCRF